MFIPQIPNRLFKFQSLTKDITEGFKIVTHDTAYGLINSKTKEIFAISSERIIRRKHSAFSILNFFDLNGINLQNIKIQSSFFLPDKFLSRFFELYNLEKILLLIYGDKKDRVKYSRIIEITLLLFRSPLFFLELLYQRLFHVFSSKFKPYIVGNDHHLCHALPAYYFSPFYGSKSLIFILDAGSDTGYSSLWEADDNNIVLLSETKFKKIGYKKNSNLSWLYSLFTRTLGFAPLSDEGKTEALAAYGFPDAKLYDLCKCGYSVNINTLAWDHDIGILKKLHSPKFLASEMNRMGKENFAATIQKFLEDTVVEYLNAVHKKHPLEQLCLCGGTVANVIMNLHIYERTQFKKLYVFPAMGDDGTALGPAIIEGLNRGNDLSWLHEKIMPYWGPSYTRNEVLTELGKWSDQIIWTDEIDSWPEISAKMIFEGSIIAIFQGSMEFGPRALGNRSILADPRDPKIREKMNLSIKRRPYFQPFCPSILESERERLFKDSYPNKHMTMAFRFKEEMRDVLPSACHIDGTARPQFVEEVDNPNYFRLLTEVKRLTGYGVVVNTSFNLHGRAMVMSPDQAIRDFLDCNLDALFIEGYCVRRLN